VDWEREILPALTEFTRLECLSPAFDPDWAARGALEGAAELLAGWARGRPVPKLRAEVLTRPGRTPVVLVEVPGDVDRTVLLYGHLDKQPPLGTWREGLGPFTPVREGDRLYGRGTADDGYALFAAVGGLEDLVAEGGPRPRVVVLIEASEESGSPDLPDWLEQLAGRLGRPDLVICLDSGCLTYDRLWATTSLRGLVAVTLTVAVLTEGVHSGLAGGVVPSSFRLLRQLLSRVEDERTGEILLAALRARVPEGHRRALTAVADELGDGADPYPTVDGLVLAGATPGERLIAKAWGPSLAVIGMAGLPALADAGNVLRPFTTARLSLRLPPSVDAAAAGAALVDALTADPPDGAQVTAVVDAAADGWVAPDPPPWVTGALDAASTATFGRPHAAYGEGGTIPFLAQLGRRFPDVPLVALGVLGPQSNAHGPNEFLHVPMAQAVTCAVTSLLGATATAHLT
jgi:acetylornithine deacetylase/succinyl-diaminopimelate desuccinylase-like protein